MGCGQSTTSSIHTSAIKRQGYSSVKGVISPGKNIYVEFIDDEDVEANEMRRYRSKNKSIIEKGISYDTIMNMGKDPPQIENIEEIRRSKPLPFSQSRKKYRSVTNNSSKQDNIENSYNDIWDDYHVLMPCSQNHFSRDGFPLWPTVLTTLNTLKTACDRRKATIDDLTMAIQMCCGYNCNTHGLEELLRTVYSTRKSSHFLSTVLSNICTLVLNVNRIWDEPPPLLSIGSNRTVTMTQQQAASLLACSFFCLFPFRYKQGRWKSFEFYQNPNFNELYDGQEPCKIEKLKCLLHYFLRITKQMPDGIITFQRFLLPGEQFPRWSASNTALSDIHLTTNRKIEDIPNVLQVDFANKYIGGGVLGFGCVQEEIRFSICPEMLVSLLLCEKMTDNECILLIGCERYCSYKGYAKWFEFDGDYQDKTPRDEWGRRWSHVVAMDATWYNDPLRQYEMRAIHRELIKAYTAFRPLNIWPDFKFGIATGNWGCGVFRGDKQMKAIIQWMASSEAERPLIYAAYGDNDFINSFYNVYDHLKAEQATVADLYSYLLLYSRRKHQLSLFDYILSEPVATLRSEP